MSAQIVVPVSTLFAGAGVPGQWVRGIPKLGGNMVGIPANPPTGIADCSNLISGSPPTLLEEYQLYSYSIGFAVEVVNLANFASIPAVLAELALLVNDRPAYVTQQNMTGQPTNSGTSFYMWAGVFVSDLVNPIRLGARDRLGLRVGLVSSLAAPDGMNFYVGTQGGVVVAAITQSAFESTISYDVIEKPGGRRL